MTAARRCHGLAWTLSGALCQAASVHAALPDVRLETPRPYGYVIGDVIKHRATIAVDAASKLDAASLPQPGPMNRWLTLRRLDSSEETIGKERRYRLTLEYQTFYAPLEVKNLSIPSVGLSFVGPAGSFNAAIPPWTFTMAPIRELSVLREGGLEPLRPDATPEPIETFNDWVVFWVCAGLALSSLGYLGYVQGWLPYGLRGRHFAEACRTLQRLESLAPSPDRRRKEFACVHRAFNLTIAEPLFAEGLDAFFGKHPRYLPLRQEIEEFFGISYALFFGDDSDSSLSFSGERMIRLCRHCLRIERGHG